MSLGTSSELPKTPWFASGSQAILHGHRASGKVWEHRVQSLRTLPSAALPWGAACLEGQSSLWGCFTELGTPTPLCSAVTARPRACQVCSGTGNNLQMTLLETIMLLPLAGGRTVKLEFLKLSKSPRSVFTTETAFPPC